MKRLAVKVDGFAVLRESRRAREPDPVAAAVLAELAGTDRIAIHLRGDRRGTQERDAELMRRMIGVELHLHMAATNDMIKTALALKPDSVSLVPERHDEQGTSGGLDVLLNAAHLKKAHNSLREAGLRVALLIDPDLDQVKGVYKLGAQMVHFFTGKLGEAVDGAQRAHEQRRLAEAARTASRIGLKVLAGGSLGYRDMAWVARMEEIEEIHVGHAFVSRACLVGVERAVRELRDAIAGRW
ncbi:MAG: pyridoxine 5'-phosphate synthase [Acidobacteriota bacterium]